VSRLRLTALACATLLLLAACSSRETELRRFIEQTQQEQATGVVALPEVKPYEAFAYSAQSLRSPFQPGAQVTVGTASVRPDSRRNREFLEQFSLDTLRMVGTLKIGNLNYGLVMAKDGLIHRVLPGHYIGQNDGRVSEIKATKISVIEIVPDGLGGFMERPAALVVNE
jgi:type IV pilus assembly protein PilP